MDDETIDLPAIALRPDCPPRAEIEGSLREFGALRLTLSSTESLAVETLMSESRAFFDLAPEAKARYAPLSTSDWTGYLKPRTSGVDIAGDDFERVAVAPTASPTPQLTDLNQDSPRLYSSINEVFDLLVHKCRDINSALSTILGIDRRKSDRSWFDGHSSHLALNHYPRATTAAMAAHKDFGGLSLIYVGQDAPGLQLSDSTGHWRSIKGSGSSTVLALVGELYSYWADGRWPAALHRVASPHPGRISIVMFHSPNRSVELASATGARPTVSTDAFMSQLEQRYLRLK